MDENREKLIELRTKLGFYKKLENKLQKVLNGELEIEDWSDEVFEKVGLLESELTNLKIEMDLPDEEWDDNENTDEKAAD